MPLLLAPWVALWALLQLLGPSPAQGQEPPIATQEGWQWISAPQAILLLAEHDQGSPTVFDVRSKDDYGKGTLPGAELISWNSLLSFPPDPSERLLVIGEAPPPGQAPKTLRGYASVWLLQGGIEAWQQAGGTVVVPRWRPAFVIPRGLCEMGTPAQEFAPSFDPQLRDDHREVP